MAAEDWIDEYYDDEMLDDPYDHDPYFGQKLSNCPECGSKLIVRKNKKTRNEFLGCSSFPHCKFTCNMSHFDDSSIIKNISYDSRSKTYLPSIKLNLCQCPYCKSGLIVQHTSFEPDFNKEHYVIGCPNCNNNTGFTIQNPDGTYCRTKDDLLAHRLTELYRFMEIVHYYNSCGSKKSQVRIYDYHNNPRDIVEDKRLVDLFLRVNDFMNNYCGTDLIFTEESLKAFKNSYIDELELQSNLKYN